MVIPMYLVVIARYVMVIQRYLMVIQVTISAIIAVILELCYFDLRTSQSLSSLRCNVVWCGYISYILSLCRSTGRPHHCRE